MMSVCTLLCRKSHQKFAMLIWKFYDLDITIIIIFALFNTHCLSTFSFNAYTFTLTSFITVSSSFIHSMYWMEQEELHLLKITQSQNLAFVVLFILCSPIISLAEVVFCTFLDDFTLLGEVGSRISRHFQVLLVIFWCCFTVKYDTRHC